MEDTSPNRSGRRLIPVSLIATAIVLFVAGCGDNDPATPETPAATPQELVQSLRETVRNRPGDAALRLALGRAYLTIGDGAAAESQLERARSLGTADSEVIGDLARSLLMQGRHFETLELLGPVDESREADPRLWMLRGEAQLGLSSFDELAVRESFLRAYRTAGDGPVSARLEELRTAHPIVAAAAAHTACRSQSASPLDPPAPVAAAGRVLKVGPGRPFATPSQAASEARDGDTIEIDAGLYEGDVAVWTANDLVLRGVGGMAHLAAAGRHADGKGIWVFAGDNITAENIEFSGATVPHHNGAGIRLAGNGATIRNCHFHDNENGILGGNGSERPILVEYSTFERNGYGNGLTHNIYIGKAMSFTLRFSYSHGARKGHLVKSRAHYNAILYNRLMDHQDGHGSYVINLPEGGRAFVIGNELQQGPAAENPIMISFGEEKSVREKQALFVINNTFYNNVLEGIYVRNATTFDAVVANNLFAGAPALILKGPGTQLSNLLRPGPWLVDAHGLDLRLTPEAPAIDAGTAVEQIAGLDHGVDAEYRHPARGRMREKVWRIDIGAHEFCGFLEPVPGTD